MKRKSIGTCMLVVLLVLSLTFVLPAQETITLVGCGSAVPSSLYGEWAAAYSKRNPQIQIKYLPLGSGEGIKQMIVGSADFGAGEIPIPNREMRAPGKKILHIPLFLTAVVPIYNVPGISHELRFSGKVLADIFTGGIKRWNHPELLKLNPGTQLPDLAITTVHREPDKGTTFLFTDFLSKTSPAFRSKIGTNASPAWPSGSEAHGGEGMVRMVKEVPGAIGYAELNVAKASGVGVGQVQNSSGAFVTAAPESAAAACPPSLKNDFRGSLTNAPGEKVYPITGLSWMFVPEGGASPARAKALTGFVRFIFTDGQASIAAHGHLPLPPRITLSVLNGLKLRH